MQKFFNIAGPCYPDKHYMLPAQERCQGLAELIAQEQYFVIHAARQSGKTTLLLDLAEQLNDEGQYYALYYSLEVAQNITEPEKGISIIVRGLRTQIELHSLLGKYPFAWDADYADFATILLKELVHFCQSLDKPLVILFDEVDCLSNGTLISFLRQLRSGYVNRRQVPFPHAVALVGLRNIRDYKARVREDRETLGSASPFNIAAESLTLRNFMQEEVARLYAQHTAQTGQVFPPEVVERAYYYTQGQPWLVNAIAREIVMKMLGGDFSQPIVAEQVDRAAQTLITRRDPHIDSLMERLREARVQKIVEPVILGETGWYDLLDDDYQYVLDLGLLRETAQRIMPANPIYAEVIVRTLSFRAQRELASLPQLPSTPAYIHGDVLDMSQLLRDFQQFWRENSEMWVERFDYKEAAPHLVLQAFLQRVVNSGGQVTREMASGTKRLDLGVRYGARTYPVELKLRYSERTYAEGVMQLAEYMDKLGSAEGWLVVFDRRAAVAWDEKIFWETRQTAGKTIHIVGC